MLSGSMNPAYRKVTVRQLLSHTAGLRDLTTEDAPPELLKIIGSAGSESAQRLAIARFFLTRPPEFKAGEFHYSNLSFILAGAVAEVRTRTWEALIREKIFAPLGIVDAGFGAPGSRDVVDQPRGHMLINGSLTAINPSDPASDNPSWMGPAGTINITLADWAKFADGQIDGPRGQGKLLQASTYRILQTPVVGAVALGWGVHQGVDGLPVFLEHLGSNGNWTASIRIYPARRIVLLLATNFGTERAAADLEALNSALVYYLKLPE